MVWSALVRKGKGQVISNSLALHITHRLHSSRRVGFGPGATIENSKHYVNFSGGNIRLMSTISRALKGRCIPNYTGLLFKDIKNGIACKSYHTNNFVPIINSDGTRKFQTCFSIWFNLEEVEGYEKFKKWDSLSHNNVPVRLQKRLMVVYAHIRRALMILSETKKEVGTPPENMIKACLDKADSALQKELLLKLSKPCQATTEVREAFKIVLFATSDGVYKGNRDLYDKSLETMNMLLEFQIDPIINLRISHLNRHWKLYQDVGSLKEKSTRKQAYDICATYSNGGGRRFYAMTMIRMLAMLGERLVNLSRYMSPVLLTPHRDIVFTLHNFLDREEYLALRKTGEDNVIDSIMRLNSAYIQLACDAVYTNHITTISKNMGEDISLYEFELGTGTEGNTLERLMQVAYNRRDCLEIEEEMKGSQGNSRNVRDSDVIPNTDIRLENLVMLMIVNSYENNSHRYSAIMFSVSINVSILRNSHEYYTWYMEKLMEFDADLFDDTLKTTFIRLFSFNRKW